MCELIVRELIVRELIVRELIVRELVHLRSGYSVLLTYLDPVLFDLLLSKVSDGPSTHED